MSAIDDAQEEVKPDMTPMIDVVFLMIIFFVCIDFKVLESKLPAYMPKDKGSSPQEVPPQDQLSVKILVEPNAKGQKTWPNGGGDGVLNPNTKRPYRYVLQGHKIRWEVGPKPLYNINDVKAELVRIVKDPSSQIPDLKNPGKRKLLPCVIEAYPDTVYDDVAKTADVCNEAGFVEINFGGGLGTK